jgi:hypothetical protein
VRADRGRPCRHHPEPLWVSARRALGRMVQAIVPHSIRSSSQLATLMPTSCLRSRGGIHGQALSRGRGSPSSTTCDAAIIAPLDASARTSRLTPRLLALIRPAAPAKAPAPSKKLSVCVPCRWSFQGSRRCRNPRAISMSARFATMIVVPSERADFAPRRRASASPTIVCPTGVDKATRPA